MLKKKVNTAEVYSNTTRKANILIDLLRQQQYHNERTETTAQ